MSVQIASAGGLNPQTNRTSFHFTPALRGELSDALTRILAIQRFETFFFAVTTCGHSCPLAFISG
jgi:hypothetical protein